MGSYRMYKSLGIMEGVVNVEWHGQDYLHLKWHVVYSEFATPGLDAKERVGCGKHREATAPIHP